MSTQSTDFANMGALDAIQIVTECAASWVAEHQYLGEYQTSQAHWWREVKHAVELLQSKANRGE